ncbi:MAG: glycosyltransferase [Nitrospirae bacterium]|nr:glycosyltransferase [Nitrospirota bacterium]
MFNRSARLISSWRIGAKLIQFLSAKGKLYDVVVVFKGAELSRSALDACRSINPKALWANYNPDDPLNVASRGSTNSQIIRSLSFYDFYFTWSRHVASKLEKQGCKRVVYLPFGYDSDFHRPPSEPVAIIPGRVTFVGAWDPERESILTELADYDLRIFGNNWDRVSKNSPLFQRIVPRNIYGEDLSRVMYSSSVCLNLLRAQNVGAHNMRTFEIPAMGGLMLATRSDEQHEFFPEEAGSLMFADIKDLRGKLDRAIGDESLARRIRDRGAELVQRHSYTERARDLIHIISASAFS